MCNSGVGLTPVVDGKEHHFSAGGLYNGLVLLIDDETRTYWDHITGEAVHGALAGQVLDTWGISLTTVEAALGRDPDISVSLSGKRSLKSWIMGSVHRRKVDTRGFLPPPFRRTMEPVDGRLPKMAQGLGVLSNGRARFYPVNALDGGIEDVWDGRRLYVARDPIDRVPYAEWPDKTRPFQLFTRWYGFVLTFPGCEVYETEPRRPA